MPETGLWPPHFDGRIPGSRGLADWHCQVNSRFSHIPHELIPIIELWAVVLITQWGIIGNAQLWAVILHILIQGYQYTEGLLFR